MCLAVPALPTGNHEIHVEVVECTMLDAKGEVLEGSSTAWDTEQDSDGSNLFGGVPLGVLAPVTIANSLVPQASALVRARSETIGLTMGSGLVVARLPASTLLSRLFKVTDPEVSPMALRSSVTAGRMSKQLRSSCTVADAIAAAGGGSNGDAARESVVYIECDLESVAGDEVLAAARARTSARQPEAVTTGTLVCSAGATDGTSSFEASTIVHGSGGRLALLCR